MRRAPLVIEKAPAWVNDELARASHMANVMDLMLETLKPAQRPMFTYTANCPKCLAKWEVHTRVRPEHAEYSVVCHACQQGDEKGSDYGWGWS